MKEKIKIKYSKLKKKSKDELSEMKKTLQVHLMNRKTLLTHKRERGFDPKELRKNIARINQRLNELK